MELWTDHPASYTHRRFTLHLTLWVWEPISIQHHILGPKVKWVCRRRSHGRLEREDKPMSVARWTGGEGKWNDSLGWMFKGKQKGIQMRGNKAQSETDELMWQSPSADSSPITAEQVCAARRRWDNANGARSMGVGGGDDGWFFTHSLSGTTVINGHVLLLWLSCTRALHIPIHTPARPLIYFHLRSQVRKFGWVTNCTNRMCPWAEQTSLFIYSSPFYYRASYSVKISPLIWNSYIQLCTCFPVPVQKWDVITFPLALDPAETSYQC